MAALTTHYYQAMGQFQLLFTAKVEKWFSANYTISGPGAFLFVMLMAQFGALWPPIPGKGTNSYMKKIKNCKANSIEEDLYLFRISEGR